jgi:hypothetical protein
MSWLLSHTIESFANEVTSAWGFQTARLLLIDFEVDGWMVGGKWQKCVNRRFCVFRGSSCYLRKTHFYHCNRKIIIMSDALLC